MLIVIDYDAGNTANVLRALDKIGVQAQLSADPQKILSASGLILPGVGAYPAAMAELEKRGHCHQRSGCQWHSTSWHLLGDASLD